MRTVYFCMERFPSGQREQTVNLSVYAFEGSNPSLSTTNEKPTADAPPVRQGMPVCGFYAGIAQLVEHQPSKLRAAGSSPVSRSRNSEYGMARPRSSVAERFLGKEEVMGPIPIVGSTISASVTSTCV